MFSLRGSSFPWAGGPGGGRSDQRTGELEANQVVAIGMGDPERSCTQITSRLGQRVGNGQRRTGNLKQNLRGKRQRAANRDQGAARGNVKRGGELKKFFAFFVPAAHKHGYRDCETWPLTTLCFGIRTPQTGLFKHKIANLPHLRGQTTLSMVAIRPRKPGELRVIPL
jgi:hypothetical protein